MNLLTRYLFFNLLKPFLFCLVAFGSLLIIVDLFGSLDDFIQNKASFDIIVEYYSVFIPGIIMLVLPTTLLFSALYALLQLSRNSELVAMQACGVPLIRIYLPFLILGLLCTGVLYLITLGPGGSAKAKREAIMQRIRGQGDQQKVKHGQIFQDRSSGRIWYLQTINLTEQSATGVEVLQADTQGRDQKKYFADHARFTQDHWILTRVRVLTYDVSGQLTDDEVIAEVSQPDWQEKPQEMTLLQLKADQLSLAELAGSLKRLHWQTETVLAPYRTQVIYLWLSPLSCLILLLFALSEGTGHHRGNAGAGVFNAIFVLIGFFLVVNICLTMGKGARFPPLIAVGLPLLIFLIVGVWRLLPRFGLSYANFLKRPIQ